MAGKRKPAAHTSAERYVEFIKSVHLSGLGMDSASFNIDREAFAKAFPPPERPSAEISGRHEVLSRTKNSFVVVGRYEVAVKAGSGSGTVNINCTLSALFSVERETDDACIERFKDNEVHLVFWPYLRHFVSDCTYRMAIHPLILPLTCEVLAPRAQSS